MNKPQLVSFNCSLHLSFILKTMSNNLGGEDHLLMLNQLLIVEDVKAEPV